MKTYTDTSGEALPIPPREELRVGDWSSLPYDRYAAVEAWWIHADHPGFGFDPEHTEDTMREAGFTEVEIMEKITDLAAANKLGGGQ